MKYLFVLILTATSAIYPQETVYFRVYAEIKNEPVFTRMLQETKLEDVFPEKFQLVVNTRTEEPFVVIGRYDSPDVEWDKNAYRYDWLFLSPAVRGMLLKCKHKINLH